jgi:hypothetical protein
MRELRHPFDLATVASLFVLTLPPGRVGMPGTVVTGVLAAVIVVIPQVRRSPWPWLVLAFVHGLIYLDEWYRLDNHDLLAAYWALAIAVAAWTRHTHRDEALAIQSRWILGTVFAVAALWKLGSGQFVDGSFFFHTLVMDPRFNQVAALTAGLSVEQLEGARAAASGMISARQPMSVDLAGLHAVTRPAGLFTAWGVVSEAAVAVGMLGPDRPGWKRFRQFALVAFMVTTYVVVPVLRFAILLGAMGMAQADSDGRWRLVYLALMVAAVAWAPAWWVVLGP